MQHNEDKKKSLPVSSDVLLNTSILQYDDDDFDNENFCPKLWLLELLHLILKLIYWQCHSNKKKKKQ